MEVEMLAFHTLMNRPALQLSPSEHNTVVSRPLLTVPFSHGFHPRLGLSSCQLDVRDEGLEEVLGSRRKGFTPLIHRRKRLNEGFEAGEGRRDGRRREERKAPEHLLRWGT